MALSHVTLPYIWQFILLSLFKLKSGLLSFFSAITCDPLGSLDHGTIECTDENYYKSSCSFECDGGFKLTEDRDAKCMGHDGWSRQKPKCVGKLNMLD